MIDDKGGNPISLIGALTGIARRRLAGAEQEFVFKGVGGAFSPPPVRECGLYIHIPFCRGSCPYCPYNKIKYDERLAGPYTGALLEEMKSYQKRLGKVELSSLYIGGGTPTTLVGELGKILQEARRCFNLRGPVCIETNPADLSASTVKKLRDCGVDLVSVGVQSFNDANLCFLGRRYDRSSVERALEAVMAAGFQSVNLDLMFALPGQNTAAFESDLALALASGASQLTFYPLFTFPYTAAGRHLKTGRVKMPHFAARRKMYRLLHNRCLDRGMERVSVWSFKHGPGPRYSSVTRDNYIGLGAGAGSHLEDCFYFNTFSVSEYIRRAGAGYFPVALKLDLTAALSRYYWLYWRLYETAVPLDQAEAIFVNDRIFRLFVRLGKLTGLLKLQGDRFLLSEKGAFWLHLAQNYFALDYINRIWAAAVTEPWPDQVSL